MRKTPYEPMKTSSRWPAIGDLVCGFVIHPSVGVKTFKEMIEYAKKNPGKLTFASAGLGTATQLRIEMLKFRTGIDILHVPYRGSADALNDLLPGTVQMMNEINVLPHVKAGKLDPAQHQSHIAASRIPRRANTDRARRQGRRRADLVLDLGAAGHAEGDRQEAQCQDRRDCKTDEMKAKMRAINVAVPVQIARGHGQVHDRGQQAQRRGDQGGQHQARVGVRRSRVKRFTRAMADHHFAWRNSDEAVSL